MQAGHGQEDTWTPVLPDIMDEVLLFIVHISAQDPHIDHCEVKETHQDLQRFSPHRADSVFFMCLETKHRPTGSLAGKCCFP